MSAEQVKKVINEILKREKEVLKHTQKIRRDLDFFDQVLRERTDSILGEIENLTDGIGEALEAAVKLERTRRLSEVAELVNLDAPFISKNETPELVLTAKMLRQGHFLNQGTKEARERLLEECEGAFPQIEIDEAVKEDHVRCLICGKSMAMLKRHLNQTHGVTPEVYREIFGLPWDFPITAPGYTSKKSSQAQMLGLGKNEPMKTLAQLQSEKGKDTGEKNS